MVPILGVLNSSISSLPHTPWSKPNDKHTEIRSQQQHKNDLNTQQLTQQQQQNKQTTQQQNKQTV